MVFGNRPRQILENDYECFYEDLYEAFLRAYQNKLSFFFSHTMFFELKKGLSSFSVASSQEAVDKCVRQIGYVQPSFCTSLIGT